MNLRISHYIDIEDIIEAISNEVPNEDVPGILNRIEKSFEDMEVFESVLKTFLKEYAKIIANGEDDLMFDGGIDSYVASEVFKIRNNK